MGLKELYAQGEEAYYAFLDRINETVPIYKIIDPIDNVVPSFALLLGIIALVFLLLISGLVLPLLMPGVGTLKISVLDEGGTPIYRADVKFDVDGKLTEAESDYDGLAVLENVVLGQTVSVTVSKAGYLTESREIEITEVPVQLREITLSEESTGYLTKTIRLVDSAGAAVLDSFVLEFSCSNPYAEAPADYYLSPGDYGVAVVQVSTDCQRLSVTIKDGTDYDNYGPVEVDRDDKTITLSAADREYGTIIAKVSSESGDALDGIEVSLYKYYELIDNPNVGPVNVKDTYGGEAEFKVSPGKYVLKTYDYAKNYGQKESPMLEVYADEIATHYFTLAEDVQGSIRILVTDGESGGAIEGATVILMEGDSGDKVAEIVTEDDGIADFGVSKKIPYNATVTAEGYALGRLSNLKISETAYEIGLEKCTPSNCGTLRVMVQDEDEIAMQGAVVVLYDASTGWFSGYGEKVTDVNGMAGFEGVASGNYWAFAFKESASGKSDTEYFSSKSPSTGINLTVNMLVGEGVIRARIADKYGEPIPFADVEVRNAMDDGVIGRSMGDANGMFITDTKADKRVYLIVGKDSANPAMADYVTVSRPIVAGSVAEFDIVMEPVIIDRDIEIQFLGMFSQGGSAKVLAAGQEYTAKFLLRVPEEMDYEEAGVHLRTGDALIMEKDGIYIKSLNVPIAAVIKATSYDEESGLGAGDYDLTAGDAKWANLVWSAPAAGLYEVWAKVKVKESASVGERIVMHYRAWAENGKRVFDPVNEKTGVEELYYTAKEAVYEVGVQTLCDDKFCFSATITDLDEGLIESVSDSYTAGIFRNYRLFFTLTNNSGATVHDNANLRIKNADEGLLIEKYSVFDAEGNERSGELQDYELPRIEVGNLTPDKKIAGTLDFITRRAGAAGMNIRLVSDQVLVFDKTIVVNVGAARELELKIQPAKYPSGIETDVNVFITDKATKLEVEGAIVRMKDRHGNVIMYSRTTKDGYAYLTLPAQAPGTKLKLEVEKQGYDVKELEIVIDAEVLRVSPDSLGVALNAKTKHEAEDAFSLTNVTFFPLKVVEIKLTGNLRNKIDTERVQQWLEASYLNLVIDAGDREEMSLKTYLSDEGRQIEDMETLEGELLVVVQNYGQRWSFTVPVTIAIGMGGEVDDPACLSITRKEWSAVTSSEPVSVEFSIQNNCTINGKPIELRDLGGKLALVDNQLGNYVLKVGETDTELRQGYFRTVLGRVAPEGSFASVLTFTPYAGVSGTSEGQVLIRAINPVEGGEQVLTVSMDTKIIAENFRDCISFDREIVDTLLEAPHERTREMIAQFTVTNSCKAPVEFNLESELQLSDDEFRVASDSTHTVDILYTDVYPGQYPIYVSAKGENFKDGAFLKILKVRLWEPGCINLNRYEFDIYDDAGDAYDGYDNAELANKCYDKGVTVSVDMKDLGAAMKEGSNWAAITFALGTITSLANKISDYSSAKKAEKADTAAKAAEDEKAAADKAEKDKEKEKATQDAEDAAKAHRKTECETLQSKFLVTKNLWVASCQGKTMTKYCEKLQLDARDYVAESVRLNCKEFNIVLVKFKEDNELTNSPATGFASLWNGDSGEEEGTSGGLATSLIGTTLGLGTSFLGGGLGGLLGLVGGAITGKGGMKSTIAATAVGFLAGTIQEYMSQETQEFWSIQRDVEIKGLTLLMHRGSDDEERDILTDWYGDAMFEKSTVDPRLKFEFRGIKFTNDSQGSFITSEEEPEYRILRVGAISHNYQDKTYNKDDFELENEKSWFGFESGTERVDTTEVKLDEDEPDNVQKYYQIEFNSVPPGEEGEESTGIINCQAGTRTGSTGREALPRVALTWDWRAIDYDACDFDNEDYIYCDATQFSIALLKKVHDLDEWLAGSSARLDCPGAMGEAGENTAEIGSYDVGISRVSAKKEGNGIAVEVEILNNDNPQEADVDLTVAVKDSEGNIAAEPCEIMEIGVLSKDIETCVFELEDGVYTATANIEVRMEGCDDCVNKTASDELRVGFSVGNSGLEECEPYSTARLDEFLAASGISEEGVLENVKFKAYLIKDRYSNDFMRDFDDYAMTMSFFNAPEWYKDRSRGLGKYFRNSDVFEFKPKYGDANPEGYALPGPGLYDVTVDITYEDDTWNLFSAGGIENAKISVELEKLDQPEPDSPFYYMPFDGPIGEDSGRVGYGVNYRGDSITINSTGDKVSTVEIPGSTPVDNGLLQVTYSDSLSRLNGGRGFAEEKGTVLKVSRAGTPSILYMPSYATPVMMGVSKETASDNEAWGFYSVAIDGRAASASETGSAKWTGTSMARWNGVGYNCRDFDDRPVTESFYESADQHGLKTSCARLGGDVAMTSYGFEFCDVIKFGNVYMKAIFYTPQGHSGMLAKSGTAKDGVSFWAGNMADARRVELNGVKGVPYNYHGTSRITSVEDVFSLVEDGYVCVSGGGTSADFWWNPAKIYGDETFQSYEDVARQNCITSD